MLRASTGPRAGIGDPPQGAHLWLPLYVRVTALRGTPGPGPCWGAFLHLDFLDLSRG